MTYTDNSKSVSQELWKYEGMQAYPSLGHQGGFPDEVTAENSLKIFKEEEISQRRRESRHSRQKYQSLQEQGCGGNREWLAELAEDVGWCGLGGGGRDGIVKASSVYTCCLC